MQLKKCIYSGPINQTNKQVQSFFKQQLAAMASPSLYADAMLEEVKTAVGDDYDKDGLSDQTVQDLNGLGLYHHQILKLPQKAADALIAQFSTWLENFNAKYNSPPATGWQKAKLRKLGHKRNLESLIITWRDATRLISNMMNAPLKMPPRSGITEMLRHFKKGEFCGSFPPLASSSPSIEFFSLLTNFCALFCKPAAERTRTCRPRPQQTMTPPGTTQRLRPLFEAAHILIPVSQLPICSSIYNNQASVMIKNVFFYETACSFSKTALSVVSSVTSGLLAARRAANGETCLTRVSIVSRSSVCAT